MRMKWRVNLRWKCSRNMICCAPVKMWKEHKRRMAKPCEEVLIVWRRKNQEIFVYAFVVACSSRFHVIPQKTYCLFTSQGEEKKLKREWWSWSEVEMRSKWIDFDKEDFVWACFFSSDLSTALCKQSRVEALILRWSTSPVRYVPVGMSVKLGLILMWVDFWMLVDSFKLWDCSWIGIGWVLLTSLTSCELHSSNFVYWNQLKTIVAFEFLNISFTP